MIAVTIAWWGSINQWGILLPEQLLAQKWIKCQRGSWLVAQLYLTHAKANKPVHYAFNNTV